MNGPAVSTRQEEVRPLAVVSMEAHGECLSVCLCVCRGSEGAGCACEHSVCAQFPVSVKARFEVGPGSAGFILIPIIM